MAEVGIVIGAPKALRLHMERLEREVRLDARARAAARASRPAIHQAVSLDGRDPYEGVEGAADIAVVDDILGGRLDPS